MEDLKQDDVSSLEMRNDIKDDKGTKNFKKEIQQTTEPIKSEASEKKEALKLKDLKFYTNKITLSSYAIYFC